ncbi:MAG: NADPH-dependent fmn reductase [Bacteroidetes bacterium]|nr:NADPH-dependent fmn reductase [Bacteroidota bacterium]
MLKIAIIIGSTRPNRKGPEVAKWVMEIAKKRKDAEYELVDLLDFNLPLLDEPVPPSTDHYTKQHTKDWSEQIKMFDGFVFVTPEYNHSTSGALKNAIDFIYKEWNNKAAGFVSYGAAGGIRAVEQLRPIMATLQIADVRSQVTLFFHGDFDKEIFKPAAHQEKAVNKTIDEVLAWSEALKTLRK